MGIGALADATHDELGHGEIVLQFSLLSNSPPSSGRCSQPVQLMQAPRREEDHIEPGVLIIASASTSSSAPGTHKRDTSTVVMVGGVVKRAARTLP